LVRYWASKRFSIMRALVFCCRVDSV
jgi:hypothetical protein